MPHKALKPCKYFGCAGLTHERYCAAHADKERISDRNRVNAARRGYGHKWRIESRKYLRQHPYCECDACRILGRRLKAEVVDHRIPHRGDPKLFWDRNNWQARSKRCHDRKTARENGGFGNKKTPPSFLRMLNIDHVGTRAFDMSVGA